MKSYLIRELLAFSDLSDSFNQIIAAAAILFILSDWSTRTPWRGKLRGATVSWCCASSKNRSGRFRITYLLSTVLSTKSSPPLMEHIASKLFRLFFRRRDGHLIAKVDNFLPIDFIRSIFCDRVRFFLIERDILHTSIMHSSWSIFSQTASWVVQINLTVIFAMIFFFFMTFFFCSGEAAEIISNRCFASMIGEYVLNKKFKIEKKNFHRFFFFRSSLYYFIVSKIKEKTSQ